MNDLFPDHLKAYINSKKINLIHYLTDGQGTITADYLMFIGSKDSLEEHVQTILHELIHLHPAFISYTSAIWKGVSERDENKENDIEHHAQEVYTTRQDIVALVKKALQEVYARSSA